MGSHQEASNILLLLDKVDLPIQAYVADQYGVIVNNRNEESVELDSVRSVHKSQPNWSLLRILLMKVVLRNLKKKKIIITKQQEAWLILRRFGEDENY